MAQHHLAAAVIGFERAAHGIALGAGEVRIGLIEPRNAAYVSARRGANAITPGATTLGGELDFQSLTGGDAQKAAITKLGLDYSLLTQYTSFIAVDKVVRNPGGRGATANQPSPLPEGVSNAAVVFGWVMRSKTCAPLSINSVCAASRSRAADNEITEPMNGAGCSS